jgi:hypothetical protein
MNATLLGQISTVAAQIDRARDAVPAVRRAAALDALTAAALCGDEDEAGTWVSNAYYILNN